MTKELKKKAYFDEFNKSEDNIGAIPQEYIEVPRIVRCIECNRLIDVNSDKGRVTCNGYICKQCLR